MTGATGLPGPQGPTGPRGATGPQGPTGLLGDSLAFHVQLLTGGWLRCGDDTNGVLFGYLTGVWGNPPEMGLVARKGGVEKVRVTTTGNPRFSGTIYAEGGEISGVLTIGPTGGIYQGTGTFSSPQTGLKIWNDGGIGRLAAYSNGAPQVYLGTDGKLYAGSGNVRLGAEGIRLTAEEFEEESRIVWGIGSATVAEEFAYRLSDGTHKVTSVYHYTGSNTRMFISNTMGFPPYVVMCIFKDGASVFYVCTFDNNAGTILDTVPIGCRVYATTSQNIPNNTLTALSFNAEAEDVGNCWSSSNPTRLVAPVAGYYIFGGGWSLAADQNPGGFRVWVGLRKNGTTLIAANGAHTVASRSINVSVTGSCYLSAGDYIEICALQDSGSTRPTHVSTGWQHAVHGWLRRLA